MVEDYTKKAISGDPDDAIAGGGLIGNTPVQVTFTSVHTGLFDYNGTRKDNPSPALLAVLCVDGSEDKSDAAWSAGAKEKLEPSPDGKCFLPVVEGAAITKSSNFAQLMTSLKDAGFDFKDKAHIGAEDRNADGSLANFKILEGLVAIISRKKPPKDGGLNRSPKKNPTTGKEYEASGVIVVDKIIQFPWDNKKAGNAATGAPVTPGAAAGADVPDALKAKCVAAVQEVLAAAAADPKLKGTIAKKDLTPKAFALASLKDDPDKALICKTIFLDAFLADNAVGEDGVPRWDFDVATKKLKAV
jgi:hypothetical protein